ncbi:MAG: nucleoside recognition domain-containing protein [Halanaerobiales bacterium]
MINILWFLLIVIGFITAAVTGQMEQVSTAVFESVTQSVEIMIALLGPMALWLGLMNIAKKSRLTDFIAGLLRPIIKYIFPDVPDDHPASAAIILNLTANILGLGNSATPLGIKAMKELQKLNGNSPVASNAMCTLLALNTSSITIIPAMIISLRVANGSNLPAVILTSTLFATGISTITAIILDKIFRIFNNPI